jgi:DNA/RNA endonuclease YhcR with UshA esterase domain
MNRYLSILAVLAFTLKSPADETNRPAPLKIGTLEAGKHYGEEMIVTGKVVQVTVHPTAVFIHLDQPYPGTPFTLVAFPNPTNQFENLEALKGKSVEVNGKIVQFKSKPEIILESTNQLKVTGPAH